MSDLRKNDELPSRSLDTIQRTVLVAILQAAAKHLHPAALHEIVLGVGVELGRQAAAEHRLARHLTGRLDAHACAQCLEAVGKRFQWTLRASVESDNVIRIDELGCAAAKFGEPNPYLLEVGYGILGGIVADEFGYAKVCMLDQPEMPPFHRTMTIYLQDTTESRAASGIVFPRSVDDAVSLTDDRSYERPTEYLTPVKPRSSGSLLRGCPTRRSPRRWACLFGPSRTMPRGSARNSASAAARRSFVSRCARPSSTRKAAAWRTLPSRPASSLLPDKSRNIFFSLKSWGGG